MSSRKDPAFPDVEAKLQKPAKQSAFEKQRVEAEAKRQREAAETAAVLEDFVKSFDHDDGLHRSVPASVYHEPAGKPVQSFSGPARSIHAAPQVKSGPGSLGPVPSSFAKKRTFQDFRRSRDKAKVNSETSRAQRSSNVFDSSDEEAAEGTSYKAEEKAVAKPTLSLSHLPPNSSSSFIRALVSENLHVENIKILPPMEQQSFERKNSSAIVTLSQETPGNEIDAAVSALQNRYLGFGYYLSLHRHLSSAVTSAAAASSFTPSHSNSHPFGAKLVEKDPRDNGSNRLPTRHGFAPPSSYGSPLDAMKLTNLLHVPVKAPNDVKTTRLISKVIENVLEHGPEFEALLMSRPEVQRDEKWAWIWDARSQGGIWYRWRLWEVVTGWQTSHTLGKFVPLFDGAHAWKSPAKRLPYEYTTALEDFVSASDYNSSDDDDDVDEGERRGNDDENIGNAFLNPLGKAKLAHLLTRLPTSLSKLRKGDIARVTVFAISRASRGANEVVDLIVTNVIQPFALITSKTSDRKEAQASYHAVDTASSEVTDASTACLVALYVVSDILSSSSTSGVRHAWRFRQLFEVALRNKRVFEHLGAMPERLTWGRLRAEKWKRSISLVLNLWEGWCLFPADTQQHFVSTFEHPPSSRGEAEEEDPANRGKWKVIESRSIGVNKVGENGEIRSSKDASLEATAKGSGEDANNHFDEADVEGEPMNEDDVDGEPIDEDEVWQEDEQIQASTMDEERREGGPQRYDASNEPDAPRSRKRMRAVDMFVDSEPGGS